MKLTIIKNACLKGRYFLLELSVPASFKSAAPGQFLHIRIEDSCDPFLRRPLSIHDVVFSRKKEEGRLKILYETVGKGTELLSQKKASLELDCLGPLGTGFDLGAILKCDQVYLVAGGIGVAPLFFLAKKITEIQKLKSLPCRQAGKIQILIGAKTKNNLLCEKEFKKLGCEVRVATEDGSKGFRGRVTELLQKILVSSNKYPVSSIQHLASSICACGPKAMLAVVGEITSMHQVAVQVSLEEFMGCGLGACLGCVIRTTTGYKRICHDGPVFDSQEIIWRE
jgi:dihydroorotate dehydrogenase electron transfer subunit